MAQFEVTFNVEPGKQPLIGISGDVGTTDWPAQLMRGVEEMFEMLDGMYGPQLVDSLVARRAVRKSAVST